MALYPKENFMLTYIFRPLANFSVPSVARTKITPNQLTILSFMFGVFAFLFYTKKIYVLGGISILVYIYLDLLDGGVARYKEICTDFGAKLDLYLNMLVWYMLPFGLYLSSNISIYLLLLVWASIAVNYIILFKVFPYAGQNQPKERFFNKPFHNLGVRFGFDEVDMQVMISIFAPFVDISYLFLIIIIGRNLDWIYRLVECRK